MCDVIDMTLFSIEAAYQFYKTKCEEESSKRRGKTDDIKKRKKGL